MQHVGKTQGMIIDYIIFPNCGNTKKIDYRNEVTCTTGQEQSTTSSHRHPEVMRKLIFLLTGPIQKLKNIWKDSRTVTGKN